MARFAIGVDIGQAQDYSVISIIERLVVKRSSMLAPDPLRPESEDQILDMYRLVWEDILPLGSGYQEVVERCVKYCQEPRIRADHKVVLDATGVGRPVRELFHQYGCIPECVTITGGTDVGKNDIGPTVPKRDLVSTAMVMLNTGRLKISKIPDVEGLLKQLSQFKQKQTSSRSVSYEAATEKTHDDRVMALCLALWYHNKTSSQMYWNQAKNKKDYRFDAFSEM